MPVGLRPAATAGLTNPLGLGPSSGELNLPGLFFPAATIARPGALKRKARPAKEAPGRPVRDMQWSRPISEASAVIMPLVESGRKKSPATGAAGRSRNAPATVSVATERGRWRGVPALRRSVSYPSPWPAGALDPFTAAVVSEEEEKAPAISRRLGLAGASGNPPSLVWLCAPQRPGYD
jgi:hypothetical protein